ncbi:MAG: methyltransferase domain-containing protein, partial [Pseudomonadota bacterium]|nr:methyltransferase domain-containing protein [Pseudomonadota bacterium]
MIEAKVGVGHKQSDAASYDEVAAAFDALTERYAAPLADRMLLLASPKPNDRILDAGTGTGLVALRAARLVPAGSVVGIDHSPGMLSTAERKAAERGLTGTVHFRQMDAETLQFADASFDAVLSLFMLYHLPDPLAALKEFHRVVRPGGRLVLGVGRGPDLFSKAGLIQAGRRV